MAITFNHNDQVYVKDGKMGIGTSNPDGPLHVVGSSGNVTKIYYDLLLYNTISFTDSNWNMQSRIAGVSSDMRFYTNGTSERMRITSGGLIGIGTTNPGAGVHIYDVNGAADLKLQRVTGYPSNMHFGFPSGLPSIRTSGNFAIKASDAWGADFYISSTGNVGIGTTNPVQTLVVDKSNSGSGGGYIRVQNEIGGSGSNVGIDFATFSPQYYSASLTSTDPVARIKATDTGAYSGRLDIQVRGTGTGGTLSTISTFDNNGRVGIGTTSPSEKLEVNGIVKIAPTNTSASQTGLILYDAGTGGNEGINIQFTSASDANTAFIGSYSYDILRMGTAGTERLRIDGSGNVGIGITSPNHKLDVDGDVGLNDGYRIWFRGSNSSYGTSAQSYVYSDGLNLKLKGDDNVQLLGDSGNVILHADYTGNVGIGTTSPDQTLHVNSSSTSVTGIAVTNTSTGVARAYFDASNGDLAGSDYMWIGQNNDLSGEIVMAQSAGAFHIKTQPGGTVTSRLTVLQDGNVGIGTTSPASNLHVNSASAGNNIFILGVSGQEQFAFQAGISGVTNAALHITETTNNYDYITLRSGNVGIGTTNPAKKLDVRGGYFITSDGGSNQVAFVQGGNGYAYFGNYSTGKAAFGNSEDWTTLVADGGNVGIGTTSPGDKLHIKGNLKVEDGSTTSNFRLRFADENTLDFIIEPSTDTNPNVFRFRPNSQNASAGLRVYERYEGDYISLRHNSGDGYIETDSDGGSIYISPQGTNAVRVTTSGSVEFSDSNTNGYLRAISAAGSRMYIDANSSQYWQIGGVDKMTLNSSGNLGIGTTSPSHRLQVDGDTYSTAYRLNRRVEYNFNGQSFTGENTASEGRRYTIGRVYYSANHWGYYGTIRLQVNTEYPYNGTQTYVIDHAGNYAGIRCIESEGSNNFVGRVTVDLGPETDSGIDYSGYNVMYKDIYIDLDRYLQARVFAEVDARGFAYDLTSITSSQYYFMSLFANTTNQNKTVISSFNSDWKTVNISSQGNSTNYIAGTLGVGTNSPGAKLDVEGTGIAATPTVSLVNTSSVTFNHTINALAPNLTAGENNIFIIGKAASTKNAGYIGYKYSSAGSNDNVLTFGHWGSDNLMNLTGDGNLGIGTESPTRKLTVNGNANVFDSLYINSSDPSTDTTTSAQLMIQAKGNQAGTTRTSQWYFQTMPDSIYGNSGFRVAKNYDGGSTFEYIRVTSAGKVGIGTSSPAKTLSVETTDTATYDPAVNASEISVARKNTSNTAGQVAAISLNATGWSGSTTGVVVLNAIQQQGNYSNADFAIQNRVGGSFVETFRITTYGDVGIGTDSPSTKLHIADDANEHLVMKLEQDNSGYQAWFEANSQDGGFARFGIGADASDFAFWNTDQSAYHWYTGSLRMVLTSGGNLGIGTSSPSGILHIAGTSYQDAPASGAGTHLGSSIRYGADTNYRLDYKQIVSSGIVKHSYNVVNNGTSYDNMLVLDRGNVGIGNDSPETPLHVVFPKTVRNQLDDIITLTATSPGISALYDPSGLGILWKGETYNNANVEQARIYTRANDHSASTLGIDLIFQTASDNAGTIADRMIITYDGNVGIGTTSPNFKLDVSGDVRIESENYLKFGGTGSGNEKWVIQKTSGGDLNFGEYAVADGRLYLKAGGNVGIGTTSPGYTLDVSGDIKASSSYRYGSRLFKNDNFIELAGNNRNILFLGRTSFANNATDQAVNIELPNESIQGYLKITLSDSYSNKNITGALTKLIPFGYNPNNSIWGDGSDYEITEAVGGVATEFTIGDLAWDATNSIYYIPIYKLSGAGNGLKIRVEYFGENASHIAGGVSLSSVYTQAAPAPYDVRHYQNINDRLGIATKSPGARLDVNSNISTSSTDVIKLSQATNGDIKAAASLGLSIQNGGETTNAADLWFTTANSGSLSERMRITSGGNVGIGTTSPAHKLDVDGNINSTGWIGTASYVDVSGHVNHRSNVRALNKAGTGWISWAGRNTGGTETVIDLAYIGTLSTSGSVTFSNYASGLLQVDANGLVSVDSSTYLTSYTETQTLDDVTTLGATTTNAIQIGGFTATGATNYIGTEEADNGTTTLVLRNYDTTLVDAGDIQGRIQFTGRYWSGSTSQLVESRIEHGHQESNGNAGSFLRFLTQTGNSSPVEQMRIDKVGNVGIGVTGALYKLDVGGTIHVRGESGTLIRAIGANNTDQTIIRISNGNQTDTGDYGFSIKYMGTRTGNLNSLSIFSDNQAAASQVEAVTIAQDGIIGFSNSNPQATVDVGGTLKASGVVTLSNYASGLLQVDASGVVSVDSSTYLTGIAANSVGITELNVSDGTSGQVLTTDGNGTLSFTTVSASGANYYLDGITRTAGTNTLVFSVNGTTNQSYTFGANAFTDTAIPVSGTDFDPVGTDNSTNVTLATVTGNYLSISGQEITAGTVPVSLGGTGATTAADARTNLGVDPAGTDNSTDVTLVTTAASYLSISGQEITLAKVKLGEINGGTTAGILATNATGVLSVDTSTYLTEVGFSDLISTPTTLAGYGITDADNYGSWSIQNSGGTATSITSGKHVRFDGSSISGAGTSADPYVVDLSSINTDTQYTAGSGLTLNSNSFSVNGDLSGVTYIIGRDTNDKYVVNSTNHAWYLDGTLDMRLDTAGNLDVDGDVIAFSTVTNSDRRLKTDISTIENASEKVSKLRGVEYTWDYGKHKGKRDIGLIAQEVEEVVPEVVSEGELLDGTTAKRVDYAKLVGLLIEANKELQERVELLEQIVKQNGFTK